VTSIKLTEDAEGKSQATPLSAWLRVPLDWYHSSTYAFFDDETHSSIRRTYTSPNEVNCKRSFCGFCGTPLSYWSESPASEAEYSEWKPPFTDSEEIEGSLMFGTYDIRPARSLSFSPQQLLTDVPTQFLLPLDR
jgi:hypothetical protein